MKRILCWAVMVCLSLSLVGCVNKPSESLSTGGMSTQTTSKEVTSKEATSGATSELPPTTSLSETTATKHQGLLSTLTLDNFPVLDGSTATIPLAIALIMNMTGSSEAEAESLINFNTTDNSYYSIKNGYADMLLVYEPAKPTVDELDVFNTLDMREIGLDALVFIVNEDNPVKSLTSDQIRDIYSGKITNWSEVGGEDKEIVPFQRPELSGSQTLMLNLMMKDTAMMAPKTEAVSGSMGQLIEAIATYNNSANAIGYSVYYYAKNMYTQPGLKFIAVDGVMPSNDTIGSREYGYISPFYGVIPLEPKPEAKALLDWLLTAQGQQLLEDSGYVPILHK